IDRLPTHERGTDQLHLLLRRVVDLALGDILELGDRAQAAPHRPEAFDPFLLIEFIPDGLARNRVLRPVPQADERLSTAALWSLRLEGSALLLARISPAPVPEGVLKLVVLPGLNQTQKGRGIAEGHGPPDDPLANQVHSFARRLGGQFVLTLLRQSVQPVVVS